MTPLEIDKNLVEQKICPICLDQSKVIDSVFTINPNSKRKIELLECLKCRHWWHNPLPTQEMLSEFYSTGSEYVVPKNYMTETPVTNNNNFVEPAFEKIFKTITNYSSKVSLDKSGNFNYLELGVGSGKMFTFFQEKANTAYGIEPGNWVSCDKKNIVSKIEDLPKDAKFDVITAHDVLEHLNNPVDILSKLSNFADDGCVIHCTFPNKDCLKAKLQKGNWHMVRPFGHLHYFSKQSIENIFKASGWNPVELKKCRISENGIIDLVKQFDKSKKAFLYRLIKSLLLGQIILGKDQWTVVAIRNK